jgi:excisionase family DNA binding protein
LRRHLRDISKTRKPKETEGAEDANRDRRDNLYTIKELSEKLELHPITLRSYIRNGKLKGQKGGGRWMITEESLKEFFAGSPPKER